ncbi:hypothetical protein [uncultured Abyssibacter sp.]|uniref:Panacea domain-containing protein n=1 Tax=uncultured Abyssibacter sp. TaxID=2320202 RepID=UPI0032B230A5
MLKAVTETAAAVANELILSAYGEDCDLPARKLVSLVYLAHGWHLGYYNAPLLNEPIVATPFGPGVASLNHRLRLESTSGIRALLIQRDGMSPRMSNPHRLEKHLQVLWTVYGRMTVEQIERLTCLRGSPWWTVWQQSDTASDSPRIIPDDLIHAHFVRRTNRHRTVANEAFYDR